MMKRDYYEVLSVSKTASADEIKKSYRALAMKYHPDRNAGDGKAEAELKFKEASEAYEILSDDNKRRTYDMNGHAGPNSSPAAWDDIFSAMANGFATNPQMKGADVEVIYYVNLKDLFGESSHTIEYKRQDKCTTCNGSGIKSDRAKQRCIICGGSGKTSKQSISHGVRHVMFAMCDSCNGQGQSIKKEDRCDTCEGKGEVETVTSFSFKLPMGMPLGRALGFQAQGSIGKNNGPRGDLYIKIVANHEHLVPSLNNPAELNYNLKIPYWKAVLGGEEKIEAPDGKELKLTIPPLCQSGTIKRVDKEGLPIFGRSDRGDLLITYNVAVPDTLSDQMKRLVESMKELENAI